MREHAKSREPEGNGEFDTFHVRRGDFQFKDTRIDAEQVYENTKDILSPNATVFIATDERNLKFFDPLREHYDIKTLSDFPGLLKDVNINHFGMIGKDEKEQMFVVKANPTAHPATDANTQTSSLPHEDGYSLVAGTPRKYSLRIASWLIF